MQKAFWIQEMMGSAADKVERVQNTFNFRVPFISGIFYCILILAMVFLYFVPLRFLVLFAGLNKFRKGLMKEMDSPNKVISLVSRCLLMRSCWMWRSFLLYVKTQRDWR